MILSVYSIPTQTQETVQGSLEEFRYIRAQQDREYEESFQMDRHKVYNFMRTQVNYVMYILV